MALIKCPECGKEISNKATNCPHCGMPISSVKHTSTPTPPADAVKCPNCGSTNVHIATQGFSTGKAVAGYLTIGAIGALAGNIGRNNVKVTCLKCGKTFNPVEEKKKQEAKCSNERTNGEKPGCRLFRHNSFQFIIWIVVCKWRAVLGINTFICSCIHNVVRGFCIQIIC